MTGSKYVVWACALAAVTSGGVGAQTLVQRINCGGGSSSTTAGTFDADVVYSLGVQNGYEGGTAEVCISGDNGLYIGGADNPWRKVYDRARADWSAYRFDVHNGDYIVRLLLAETLNQGEGLRELDVTVEGQPVLTATDVAAEVGVQYGAEVAVLVTVADGRLDVVASPGPGVDPPEVEGPLLNGIQVYEAPGSFPGPAAPTGLVAKDGYHTTILAWDWNVDPNVEAFRILRADAPGGPYAQIDTVWANPPRYFDPSAVLGQTHYYKVVAVDLDGNASAETAPASAVAIDSATSALPVYELTVAPADLEFISKNITLMPSEEVPATFEFDGEVYTAEARFRGSSSRLVSKKSWKVKFPQGARFKGRTDLNLKASFFDYSLIRERLAASLYADAGVASPLLTPVHLVVNGEYLGVFNQAERIDQQYLDSRGLPGDATIYNCDGNLMSLPLPEDYEVVYEKETNESSGHADIIALIDFLENAPAAGFEQALTDVFDVDAYLSYLAAVAWTGDVDTVTQNYYLIHDLDEERWTLVPWDSDYNFGLVPSLIPVSILFGTSAFNPNPAKFNQLKERVLELDFFLWRYIQKIYELESLYFNSTVFDPRIDAFHADILTDAQRDPFKLGWEDDALFLGQPAYLKSVSSLRATFVLPEAATLQPASPPTDVWINEFVAADQTTFMDEVGQFEDWVELYNASGAPLDVSGMLLTDDLSAPPTWAIPAGTVIPAGGHLVVFCDNDVGDGPLHATFGLGAGGEELGLFDTDGTTLLDYVAWNRQVDEVAYGRRQDGSQLFQLLPTPTPGAPNVTTGNLPPFVTWVETVPALPSSSDATVVSCLARDADGLQSVTLSWQVDGGGYASVAMTDAGCDRFEATIPAQPDGSLVEYYVTVADTLAATASQPEDAPGDVFSYFVTDPVFSGLRINEIMASNDTTVQDEAGDFDDWIEIYNETGSTIDLSGMYLTDDLGDPTEWQIPVGTMLAGNDYLLVWADDEPGEGPLHATFGLSGGGEEVGLFAIDGSTLIDGFGYGPQTADVALGLLPDASTDRFLLFDPSPGASNLPAQLAARTFEYSDAATNPVTFTPTNGPAINQAWTFDVADGAPLELGVALFGLSPLQVVLPPDGVLMVSPISSLNRFFVTDGSGEATVTRMLPNNPSAVGLPLYAQCAVTNAGYSNGVVGTIGM